MGKIKFKGKDLQTQDTVKYLCIHFDDKLSWDKQIKEICHKINFKLSKIRPLARFLNPIDINMLIRAFVLPYIHYCSTTWSSVAPHLINKTHFFCRAKTKFGFSNFYFQSFK